jgi:hypothetical protein
VNAEINREIRTLFRFPHGLTDFSCVSNTVLIAYVYAALTNIRKRKFNLLVIPSLGRDSENCRKAAIVRLFAL